MKNINLKTKFATICKNGGLFLLLLLLTFYMIFRETEPGQIMVAVSQADIRYLLAATCAMGIFLLGEGINIGRCLQLFDRDRSVFLLIALLLLVLLILTVLLILILLILVVLRHEGTPPFGILQCGCGQRRNGPSSPVQALFLPER